MEKRPYQITEHAGTHVAGRRIEDRDAPLHLTEAEAAYELQIMTIRPWPEGLHIGEATGVERIGIEAPADGVVREVQLGEPGALPALPAAPVKPRSKKR
ncbi:MAG: hypothetical protein M9955_17290 [Rhizobiaceae bacterium]|nr:hypothetical protein [Rhizobiaceae bacterium]